MLVLLMVLIVVGGKEGNVFFWISFPGLESKGVSSVSDLCIIRRVEG